MNARHCFLLAIAAAIFSGAIAFSQRASGGSDTRINVGTIGGGVSSSPGNINIQRMEAHAAVVRNTERQKSMVEDTQQLLKLANELNDEVNQSAQDSPSTDAIKRAQEIEKLAKHVKDKMKGEY
jgi:hypothetical protein